MIHGQRTTSAHSGFRVRDYQAAVSVPAMQHGPTSLHCHATAGPTLHSNPPPKSTLHHNFFSLHYLSFTFPICDMTSYTNSSMSHLEAYTHNDIERY